MAQALLVRLCAAPGCAFSPYSKRTGRISSLAVRFLAGFRSYRSPTLLGEEHHMTDHPDTIVILDFGGQYTHLIGRRIRELHVYCEIVPHDRPWGELAALNPKGIVLSGSPFGVYEPGAPDFDSALIDAGVPILGICYGLQLLSHRLGGKVERSQRREYGRASVELVRPSRLFEGFPRRFEA